MKIPPPAFANASPYVFGLELVMVHPGPPSLGVVQSVELTIVLLMAGLTIEQP